MPPLPENSPARPYFEGFVQRYNEGPSHTNVSGAEAVQRFEQMIVRLDQAEISKEFVTAAEEVVRELSESERMFIASRVTEILKKLGGNVETSSAGGSTAEDVAKMMGEVALKDRRALIGIFGSLDDSSRSINSWADTRLARSTLAGIAARIAGRILLG